MRSCNNNDKELVIGDETDTSTYTCTYCAFTSAVTSYIYLIKISGDGRHKFMMYELLARSCSAIHTSDKIVFGNGSSHAKPYWLVLLSVLRLCV